MTNVLEELKRLYEATRIAHQVAAKTCSDAVRAREESHTPSGYEEMKKADAVHEIAVDTHEACRFEFCNQAFDSMPALLRIAEAAKRFKDAQCELLKSGESPFAALRPRYEAVAAAKDALFRAITALTQTQPPEAKP